MESEVFLGGTHNSDWRSKLVPLLDVKVFDPVVKDWNTAAIASENYHKANTCDVHLYVITSEMESVYSFAEVIDSLHTKGKKTILHIIPSGFTEEQLKSLQAVVNLVKMGGGIAYIDEQLERTAFVINYAFG